MSRKRLLTGAIIAFVGLMLAFAMNASAFPGSTSRCDNCHEAPGTNPVATLVSNNGVTATYNVSSGGLEWAVFSGTTFIAGQAGATGQFTVAVGGSYTLFGVEGFPGPMGVTTVTPVAPATFTITPSAGPNGAIAPSTPQSVTSGSNVTFMVVPNAGYHILDVLVDGNSVGAVGTYTFTNVTANHTISATFEANAANMFTLTPTAGANGAITPAAPQTVASGSNVTFTVTPNAGYHILDVLVDGNSVGAVGTYTFTNVTANHTISATFEANSQEVMPTSITLHASAFKVMKGEEVLLSSVLSGGVPAGTEVEYLMKKPGSGKLVLLETQTVSADGSSSLMVTIPKNGSYFFQVQFLGNDSFAPSTSRTIHVVASSSGKGGPKGSDKK